jgi:hypothetical protein
MSLKEKIINYLQSDRRKEYHIPEFGETIYFTPVTVLEMEKIMTLSGGGTSSKDFHLWTIIEKAEDEKGQKIFSIEDRPYLEKMDWSIVSRISNEIQRTISFDEAKKNSSITPS